MYKGRRRDTNQSTYITYIPPISTNETQNTKPPAAALLLLVALYLFCSVLCLEPSRGSARSS